ncbi:hypothetical protein, partial [Variovorax sp. JS1663]|uniref:hypothetical protein n=1 Tax=Variovorax sp. JS1663 TaxID=1851577 RepID=UPI00117E7456
MSARIQWRGLLAVLLGFSVLVSACGNGPGTSHLSERQVKAQAMFAERCKTAGEKIHKTVENVEGVYLLKIRSTTNYGDQFKLDDPYGHDSTGDAYILNFLRGFYHQRAAVPVAGEPPQLGYSYVEALDPQDGKRYRYTGTKKAVRKKDVNAPGVQFELKRNPSYDLNIYEFVLDRAPVIGSAPRYGVTYDDISTLEEREYWIAGSSLKVIDLQTNEVIAERVGYMMDWAQGSRAGGRSPWLFEVDPLSRTPYCSHQWSPECPNQSRR